MAAFCLAGGSVSAGQEGRYLAVFADGSRVVGDELSGWGRSPATPSLAGTALADPKRPLRWFQTMALPLWNASTCVSGYVEFVGGDRLIGQVTGLDPDQRGSVDPAVSFLRIRPVYGLQMPPTLGRSVVRVSEASVRRIVWGSQPHRIFQASTIFLRDGGRLRFTSLRWYAGGVRVLLKNDVRRVALSELAELHMPPIDPWKAYLRELAILHPGAGESLFRVETADGMIMTCSPGRFKAAEIGKPK